jgi:chemotaxis signal transduction protein
LELAQIFEYKNEIFHFQNLHKKLKHNFPAEIVGTRILLSNIDNNKTAIIVDNIKEYVTVNNKAQEFLKVVPVTDIDYIAAKITYEGRTILVPDLNKICRDELASLHI